MAFTVTVPHLGESVDTAEVTGLLVAVGDVVHPGQDLVEVETGKAAIALPSPVGGVVRELLLGLGAKVKVGDGLLVLAVDESATPAAQAPAAQAPAAVARPVPVPPAVVRPPPAEVASVAAARPSPAGPQPKVHAAPGIRRLAREIGVPLAAVRPTGADARVTSEDVKRTARDRAAPWPPAVAPGSAPGSVAPAPAAAVANERLAMALCLTETFRGLVTVTQFGQADGTEIEALRHRLDAALAGAGGATVTLTAILLKLCASALRRFPGLTAGAALAPRPAPDREAVHLGVVVATPRGLLVPVVRDVDRKSLCQVSTELADLGAAVRAGGSTPEPLADGGFIVMDLGGLGAGPFTPLGHWPAAALLAVAPAELAPQWHAPRQQFEPRPVLPLALTHDRRLVGGTDAAGFLPWLTLAIETPLLALVEGGDGQRPGPAAGLAAGAASREAGRPAGAGRVLA